jgi:hypothetical protein
MGKLECICGSNKVERAMDYCSVEFPYYVFGVDSFYTKAGGFSIHHVSHYMHISVPCGKDQHNLLATMAGIYNSELLRQEWCICKHHVRRSFIRNCDNYFGKVLATNAIRNNTFFG